MNEMIWHACPSKCYNDFHIGRVSHGVKKADGDTFMQSFVKEYKKAKMKKSTLAVQHYRKAHGGKGCPSWQIQVNRLSHEEQEKNNEACREIEKLVRRVFSCLLTTMKGNCAADCKVLHAR